jgi:predicted ATPase/DNA-binding SARP family transcriptional activator
VGILGALEVEQDGHPVGVGGGRLRALLVRLILDAGRPVSVGRLVDAVWEEDPPADQTHALQSLVSRLRGSLGQRDLVASVPGGYRLAVDPQAVDAHHFEALAAAGRATLAGGDPEGAARTLREALALWRGPALADVVDYRFAVAAAARLEDLRLGALADRIAADLTLGGGARLVGELEALVAEHPLNERIAAQLIEALYAAGRQADALAVYERVRVRLADELGASPSPPLQAVHLAVLRGDPELAPAAPAPAAASVRPARRSNLPAPVTSFVGREGEIAQIGALLEQGRLVTLVGPGGAGKTRLAREAVAGWVERVPDGVWLVELAPVTASAEVVPAALDALGLREAAAGVLERPGHTARDGLDRLLDVLAEREAIVVLDNCEHLIASVAELVDRMLGACPGVRVVATSREPLTIAGESLVPVVPLGLPEPDASAEEAIAHPAVRLFADRAAAARPGFAVDGATVAAAVEICRRLDGLPLALELAAARLRSLPVEEVARLLDDRFRLLTGGSRTALARHRTLRAVVDWSWELLSEPDRRLARRLAVFAAGATVESAAAACADDGMGAGDVLDGVGGLVDRSLLQAVADTSPPRYRMLETIREYGLERLAEAGELESVRAAHARYFVALATTAEPQLRGHDQAVWFARLQHERENILAALRHLGDTGDAAGAVSLAVTLLPFWLLSGSQAEATTWLGFALAVPGDADPADRVVAEMARVMSGLERRSDAATLQEDLQELSARVGTIEDGGRPLVAVAKPLLAMMSGDQALAEQRGAEAADHPDPWVRAAMSLFAAANAENEGDIDDMRRHLDATLAGFAAIGDRWGRSMALIMESGWLMVRGDLDGAERATVEAREGVAGLNPGAGAGMLDMRLADIRTRRGDLDGARAAAAEALAQRDIGSEDTTFFQASLARAAWLGGDLDEARRELADATRRMDRSGPGLPQQGHGRAIIGALIAAVETETGDLDRADAALRDAYVSGIGTADMPIVAAVGLAVAGLAARRGHGVEAAQMLGACAAVRGAEDLTNPEVARLMAPLRETLGEDAFADAYARGRALAREDALALLDPAASRAAAVGP